MTSSPVTRVVSLHRYPVKSMLGEHVMHLDLDQRGCLGDRLWSVRTAAGKIGSGKNSSRFAAVLGLLDLRATEHEGQVTVAFPDGTSCRIDAPDTADRLSRHVGQQVTLEKETGVSHFDDGPVSLIGRASIAALADQRGEQVDASRFRTNIVIETSGPFVEDGWVGRHLRIGSAVLQVTMTSPRCVMVNMKTADLPAQPGNLVALGRVNGACLGVVASVVVPGRVSVDDPLVLDGR
ncbi:MAG: uncharacterized protein QOJ03_1491 [Frankiaceae bacterium]|nr:uncharacterized protein [Frankiaceae bacterium]